MPLSSRCAALALLLATMTSGACGSLFGPDYEYEEELYLDVDGAATVRVNASIAALVALHGAPLDPRSDARPDPERIRGMFSAPGVEVDAPKSFTRRGRRFIGITMTAPRLADLQRVRPLSWSTYEIERSGDTLVFHQTVGRPTATGTDLGGLTGRELVGFRLHAPSRVLFENATSDVQRGNILAWEQTLSDRRAGTPLDLRVEMESESILHSTLLLFGGAAVAASAVFAIVIWRLVRRGRKQLGSGGDGGTARNQHGATGSRRRTEGGGPPAFGRR